MFVRIAHRGASAHYPENTILAFEKAIESGCDMIELDVHICKTGEIIVMHDETVDRTTNGTGLIAKKTFEEIKKLRINGDWQVPILEEVLECVNRRVKINVEIKNLSAVKAVVNLLKKYVNNNGWHYDDFVISSSDQDCLLLVKKFDESLLVSFVYEEVPIPFEIILQYQPYSVNIDYKLVNKNLVNKIHNLGIKLFVWTVNEKKKIEELKSMAVDGIFSDYPEIL